MELATTIFNRLSEAFGNQFRVKEVPASEYSDLRPSEENGPLKFFEHDYLDCTLTHPTRPNTYIRMLRMPTTKALEARRAYEAFCKHLPNYYGNFSSWYTAARITNLSDVIRKHDSWSSVHIAVQAGLDEVLTREQVGLTINNSSCDKSKTPMHLSCDLNQLAILKKCFYIGGDPALCDDDGNTVLHYAVSRCTSKFVKFLCGEMTKRAMDVQNRNGETALHIAIQNANVDYATALLDAGAGLDKCSKIGYPVHYALKHMGKYPEFVTKLIKKDSNQVHYECGKYKSLPIHWCRKAEDVDLLLSMDSRVEFTSAMGNTPLHVMVKKNRLDAAIGLIFQHADINIKGNYGNTPLHLAIQSDNKMLVKMLLLYGADCHVKNEFDETPGLLAIRNSKSNRDEILKLLSSVGGIVLDAEGQSSNTTENSEMVENEDTVPKKKKEKGPPKAKILCLDGGGIRGLVLTQILFAIEEETGKKSKDLFDWICGTSTGGLLALALCQGHKAIDCQSIYFRLKDMVFTGPRPYDSGPMEKFLKEVFGESTTLASMPKHPKVIVTSVLADQRPAKFHLFRNYDTARKSTAPNFQDKTGLSKSASFSLENILQSPIHTPLWQVARSSGAAPTYFRPMANFLDGGIMANNPTIDSLTEIHRYNKVLKKAGSSETISPPGLVISIGSGQIPTVQVKSVDVAPSANPIALYNSAMAGLELTQIMIDAAMECNSHVDHRAAAWCDSIDVPYFRLTPQLKEEVALNEVKDEKLIDMLWTTKLYLQKNKHVIKEIASLLTSE